MKILLYTQYFPPEANAPANRWDYFTRYLIEKGHEVTVLTSFPNHPSRKLFPGYKNSWCRQEEKNNIKIIRTWTFISASTGFLPRLMNYLSFAFSSYLNSGKIGKVDLIIASLPSFFLGITGQKIAGKRTIPLVLDIRDLWPEAAVSTGYLKRGLIYYLTKRKIQNIYKRATQILVNSSSLLEDLIIGYGLERKKIVYIPNGADMDFFAQKIDYSFLERQYHITDSFIVLYAGLLGFAQAPEVIIESANLLKDKKDIIFLLVGTGPLAEKLKIQTKKLKLTNVIFTGLRPYKEIPQFAALADVCLIPYKNKEDFKKNIPSKMFDYMAAGKPIIINLEGEAAEILKNAKAGLVALPENPRDLADNILKLHQDKFLKQKMGFCAKTYAQNNYNKKDISRNLELVLKNVPFNVL